MPFSSRLEALQAEYTDALTAFKHAQLRLSAAKKAITEAEGRAITPARRDTARRASRRAQLLRSHPELRKLSNVNRRKALDQILDTRDKPRIWTVYMDEMQTDLHTGVISVYRSDREKLKLYRAALIIRARLLREQANNVNSTLAVGERTRLRDNARTVELHLQGLVDSSPRQLRIHWPTEWREISLALRPEGSRPRGRAARRLFSVYQHIIKTHKESDT